jgi:hypothetical protein
VGLESIRSSWCERERCKVFQKGLVIFWPEYYCVDCKKRYCAADFKRLEFSNDREINTVRCPGVKEDLLMSESPAWHARMVIKDIRKL